MTKRLVCTALFLTTTALVGNSIAQNGGALQSGEDADDWAATEYSGSRTVKDFQTAMASKGFTWLSGSPADNEKLSIGKNAQFFGFVALRYQSGRAANRGALGRAFFAISNSDQREILANAVLSEDDALKKWWGARDDILRIYENHLYTGLPIDENEAMAVGAEFSKLGAIVAIHEARGFAALEDTLSESQQSQIKAWRADPEIAQDAAENVRVTAAELDPDQYKQLEDLFAKGFSWLTGTPEDNEIIPLGQPAQFFGFVSIRHKSGHGANRGQIAKSFTALMQPHQLAEIEKTVHELMPVVERFLEQRHLFLEQLALLRSAPDTFDEEKTMTLAAEMGKLEIEAGWIEAKAYRKIRETMTQEQLSAMMAIRANYVLDDSQMESLSTFERGAQLATLCAGCHGTPGQNRSVVIAPSLDSIFERPVASAQGFEYSEALKELRADNPWSAEELDAYLADPRSYAPGTKMEFQGLLNAEDRQAVILYLQQTL